MRIFALASTMALVTALGVSANAQKPMDDPRREDAARLFDEGMRLKESNRVQEALEKYEKSYALYPSPNTLLNIARNEQRLGRNLNAIRHYREALRSPLLPLDGVEYGKKYIAELEPSFAQLDLTGPTGLVVSLGHEEVRLPLPEPLDIEPEQVTAFGVLRGQRYEGSGKAVAGKVVTIEMKVPGALTQVPNGSRETYWTGEHMAGVTLGGLAVVAAGVGVGFLAARSAHVADTRSVDSHACATTTSSACTQFRSAHDSAKTAAIVSGASFGAAAVLGVAAGYLLWPKQKEGARVSARVLPTGVLVDGAF